MRFAVPGLLVLLAAAPLTAQTATLSGSVFCADNGAPARFARVMLKPVASSSAKSTTPPSSSPAGEPMQLNRLVFSEELASPGTVSLDGRYSISGIAPGSYYVHATMPGYTDPLTIFTNEELNSTDPAIKALIAQAVPILTVVGTEASRIDLRLERSAAISGRILYDDGSPAQGWSVSIQRAKDAVTSPPQRVTFVGGGVAISSIGTSSFTDTTDDRGIFRVASLAPGNYLVRASYNGMLFHGAASSMRPEMLSITIYNGSVFRAPQAKPISITAGEEHDGVNITIPLNGLRSISGHVVAQSDSHPVNSGFIVLTTADDPSFSVSTGINPDGSFLFHSIPGKTTYTLRANGNDARSADASSANATLSNVTVVNGMKMTPFAQAGLAYGNASTDVHLEDGDITGLTIALPPSDSISPSSAK